MRGDIWRADMLTFRNGVKIKAIGATGQARGRRNLDMSRPDFALGDDMESKETAASPDQTAKIMTFWLADVLGSLNPDTGWAQLWGTFLSGGAMLPKLCAAHPERSCVVELFDDNYKSRYPEVFPDAWIEQKRQAAVKEGKLDELWAEYRNKTMAAENQKFKQEMFGYWDGVRENLDRDELVVVLIGDPGHTSTLTADGSAIHVVGFTEHGTILDLEYVNVRATNADFYEEIARLVKSWDIGEVYVDDVGVKEYLTTPLRQYLATKGLWCEVFKVPSRGSKHERMLALRPLYLADRIKHNAQQCLEMESQLLAFPKSEHDDLHDCLAYAPFVAEAKGLGLIPAQSAAEKIEEEARRIIRMRVV
jgi:phage terminase large subunit-like protein